MKTLAIVVMALCAGVSSQAQKEWSFSFETAIKSRYVGSTVGALFIDQPVSQSSLVATHKSGFYTGIWRSDPLNRKYYGTFAEETDWMLGHNSNIDRGRLNLDVLVMIYDLKPTTDMYALNLTLSSNRGKVRPYLTVEHDIADSSQLPSGTAFKAGVKMAVPRTDLKLDMAALANHHPYGFRSDPFSALRLAVSNPLAVKGGLTITPNVVIQQRFGHRGLVGNEIVWGLSASRNF